MKIAILRIIGLLVLIWMYFGAKSKYGKREGEKILTGGGTLGDLATNNSQIGKKNLTKHIRKKRWQNIGLNVLRCTQT